MEGRALWINLGAVSALAALVVGGAINMPTERKMRAIVLSLKGPPTAAQAQEMQALGMKMGKGGVLAVTFISLAFLLMLMQRVFV